MGVLLIIIGALVYFAPTIVGLGKGSVGAIFLLNLLLGWTGVGWFVALIWALVADGRQTIVYVPGADPRSQLAIPVGKLYTCGQCFHDWNHDREANPPLLCPKCYSHRIAKV